MPGKDGWLFPAWEQVRRADLSRLHDVTGTIGGAIVTLRTAGIETAILLIPMKSRIYRDFLPADLTFSPDAERRYGIALADLTGAGAIVADLAALFGALRRAQPDSDLFFRADTHWLTTASEPAAAELAKQIEEKGHLPTSRKPGITLGPPRSILQARNDLAALLPVAEQARYPFEQYSLRMPVVADAETGLLDDDWSDVTVIGNSFVQPNYGFAAMLSNRLNRPVALNWKVHQYSPYWLLLNYLHSDGFRKQRPTLIVWNFHEADMEVTSDDTAAWGESAMPPARFMSDLKMALAA